MTRESLARRFRPAGFEQPENSRRNYVKPRRELQYIFDRWVEEISNTIFDWCISEEQYNKAFELVKPLGEIPYREANSLLADFNPKTEGQKEAGLFVSACYTHSPENTIIFDLDAPEIHCIGYGTNKNIVNNGKVGKWFARGSSGLSVNNGECGNFFANLSSGLSIKKENRLDWFSAKSSGLVIVIEESKGYWIVKKDRTIKPVDCERIPGLKEYLDELGNLTKAIKDEESAKIFLERYGPEPKEKIERDIQEILWNREFEI